MGRNGAIVLLLIVGIGIVWLANSGRLGMVIGAITGSSHPTPLGKQVK